MSDHSGNIIKQSEDAWRIWRGHPLLKLWLENPPCKNCLHWRPEIKPSINYFDGIALCHAEEMFHDFSCFRMKEE